MGRASDGRDLATGAAAFVSFSRASFPSRFVDGSLCIGGGDADDDKDASGSSSLFFVAISMPPFSGCILAAPPALLSGVGGGESKRMVGMTTPLNFCSSGERSSPWLTGDDAVANSGFSDLNSNGIASVTVSSFSRRGS